MHYAVWGYIVGTLVLMWAEKKKLGKILCTADTRTMLLWDLGCFYLIYYYDGA